MGTDLKTGTLTPASNSSSHLVTLVEAVTLALRRALRDDPDVVVFGEDVGVNGGVFRATAGLQQEFGLCRVMDTPLAETLIAGMAVGMATQGLKPVAEIQFLGFIYAAMEHVISHAARMRNRTRGRLHCPLVIRAPYGGGIHAPEHHSESTEALFAHIPGLRVVIPSSPQRAYGLLLAAIEDPDPVIFLEPKRIYRSQRREVIDDGQGLPLDTCFTLREGGDVTLIGWGAMIPECLAAADTLAADHISAEVIDVATLAPIDMETLLASLQKTGRVVIAHEAPHHGGLSAQIAADLSEHGLLHLQAPIQRVTGFNTPMPLLQNEQYYLPNSSDIVAAAHLTLDYS